MSLYWIKTNQLIKKIFRNYIWDVPNKENKIYLTFDDGPTPEVTDWVLKQLQKHKAKATFFCIGKNIKNHPDLFSKIITAGHKIGNHTFDHCNGWQTSIQEYLKSADLCQIASGYAPNKNINDENLLLFRPPYGKIRQSQAKKLRQLGYKIIMWDVLSADFDTTITKEKCLDNVVKNVKSGSVIVFHDSVKAFPNLEFTLPRALKYLKEKGFVFEALD